MLTIIHGLDKALVKSEAKRVLKAFSEDAINYLSQNVTLDDLALLVHQVDLFNQTQVYVAWHDKAFTSLQDFKQYEHFLHDFLNSSKQVILMCPTKLATHNVIDEFLKKCKVINVKKLDDKLKYNYIQNLLETNGYRLSSHELDLLDARLVNDAAIIQHELNKLFLFKAVNEESIKNLICDYKQANIFELVKACFNADLNTLLTLYENFFKQDPDLNYIIHMIGLQLSQLLGFIYLKYQGRSGQEIMALLGLNYYFYQNIAILLRNQSISSIYKMIDTLYEVDVKVKKNLLDKNNAFKYFLLKLFK